MYKVEITKPAEKDILEAAKYISEQLLNPVAANRLLDEAEKALLSLDNMPYRHALVNDEVLARLGIRFMPVLNHTAFYTVREDSKTVVVQRFLYSRRNWAIILKEI
ncbi:MAG: type II toxin-antitoxin system RelE/ParE family toxin [Oscillospiraceae bacterium]|nr:type II toxin-antitoxin system RelE/ParE family toxin [Oscillospiraceae bacterium]